VHLTAIEVVGRQNNIVYFIQNVAQDLNISINGVGLVASSNLAGQQIETESEIVVYM
jgi:hypothetical protein